MSGFPGDSMKVFCLFLLMFIGVHDAHAVVDEHLNSFFESLPEKYTEDKLDVSYYAGPGIYFYADNTNVAELHYYKNGFPRICFLTKTFSRKRVLREWHENGKIKKITNLLGDLAHGVTEEWDKNGEKLGAYDLSMGSGRVVLRHPGGAFYKCYQLNKGKYEGKYVEFYKNENVKTLKTYYMGEICGLCFYYYPDGSPQRIMSFDLDGKWHGADVSFDQSGAHIETKYYFKGLEMDGHTFLTNFKAGKIAGVKAFENPEDYKQLAKIHQGQKEVIGAKTAYDSLIETMITNMMEEGKELIRLKLENKHLKSYVADLPEGSVSELVEIPNQGRRILYYRFNGKRVARIDFSHVGTPKRAVRISSVGGREDGRELLWHENGVLHRDQWWRNDYLHGQCKEWTVEGHKTADYIMDNGTGRIVRTNSDKTIARVEEYLFGYLHGKSIRFHANNIVGEVNYYDLDTAIGIGRTYYSDGVPKSLSFHYGNLDNEITILVNYNNDRSFLSEQFYVAGTEVTKEQFKHLAKSKSIKISVSLEPSSYIKHIIEQRGLEEVNTDELFPSIRKIQVNEDAERLKELVSLFPSQVVREDLLTGDAGISLFLLNGGIIGRVVFSDDGLPVRGYINIGDKSVSYEWHKNGKIASIVPRKNGYENGQCFMWFDDGAIKARYKMQAGSGIKVERYKNGNIARFTELTDGNHNGRNIAFYENGNVKSSSVHKMNSPIGMMFSYYENGRPQSLRMYNDNRDPHGAFVFFQESGQEDIVEYFIDGKKIDEVAYGAHVGNNPDGGVPYFSDAKLYVDLIPEQKGQGTVGINVE